MNICYHSTSTASCPIKKYTQLMISVLFCVYAVTAQAYNVQVDHLVGYLDPPSSPLVFSVSGVTVDIADGGSEIIVRGTVQLDTTNNQPLSTATQYYDGIYVNGNLYPIPFSSGATGFETILFQQYTYSVQPGGDCSISITDGPAYPLEVGTTLGTPYNATLTVQLLGVPDVAWNCTDPHPVIALSARLTLSTSSAFLDTDNDGITDENELNGTSCPGGVITDPLNADTDNDGILDGTECGLSEPETSRTDLSIFVADSDSLTTTNPADDDTDNDGLLDGSEDVNANGVVDAGESDPNNIDSDNDGLLDGTESGLSAPEGIHTDLATFIADLDPSTVTVRTNDDTDGDGLLDGVEDANHNGRLDEGETDPLTPDVVPPPPSISCLDAATSVIGAARDYQSASRLVKRKCGQQTSATCSDALQAQINTFALLEAHHANEIRACQP